jgi:hypothetical protein
MAVVDGYGGSNRRITKSVRLTSAVPFSQTVSVMPERRPSGSMSYAQSANRIVRKVIRRLVWPKLLEHRQPIQVVVRNR